MDALEFLEYARTIAATPGCGEPEYRSATSRAYYGVFHLARLFLEETFSFYCTGGNEHQAVCRHFGSCKSTPEAAEIGSLLANLHENRKQADYKLKNKGAGKQATAQLCLQRADAIKAKIDSCRDPKKLPALQSEMAAWRKIQGLP
jgi:uncharacterized protein (UPF0332 family)